MSKIIGIKNLNKSYNTEKVIKNFNYTFNDTGFYVFMGTSGCGKTTLINSIMGLIDFEGLISINGTDYKDKVDYNTIKNFIGYITQDVELVEYLTIEDNLKLCSLDDDKIKEITKHLGIENILKKYPNETSGGEKERVAIAQSLIQEKSILILDEPTSSLDKKNKREVFKLLKEISKEKLVICATHDKEILEYSSHIIDLTKNLYNKETEINTVKKYTTQKSPRRKMTPFIFKQNKYKNREKKSSIIVIGVFILSLLTIFLCTQGKDKILKTMINLYDVNYIEVKCHDKESCLKEFEKNDVVHHSFVYKWNIPDETIGLDPGIVEMDYDGTTITLPFDKNLFPYHNEIIYGTYFTDEYSILINYQTAYFYAQNHDIQIKEVVGKTIHLNLYGGSRNFKVAGIFKPLSQKAEMYLLSSDAYDDRTEQIFINDLYLEKHGKQGTDIITYYAYFKDKKKLANFYLNGNQDFMKIDDMHKSMAEHKIMLLSLQTYFYPVIIIAIIISLVFYFQTKLIELKYKNYIFGVYEYYGYSLKEIKLAYFKFIIIDIIKKYLIACVLAILLSIVIDELNTVFTFFKYHIFSINIKYIIGILFLLIIVALVLNTLYFIKMKNIGWYENMKVERDLI